MTLSASPVGVTVTVPSLGAVAVGGVGLSSLTLTVNCISPDSLPWLSIALYLTIYVPGFLELISFTSFCPFTDTISVRTLVPRVASLSSS